MEKEFFISLRTTYILLYIGKYYKRLYKKGHCTVYKNLGQLKGDLMSGAIK